MSVEDQVVSLFAGTTGFLDDIPVGDVRRFEEGLLQYVHTRHPEVGKHIAEQGDLPDEVRGTLQSAVEEFKRSFTGA
jgi:F-type H+-transporting ATPase subunit alpha